jgi:hypothetical protein
MAHVESLRIQQPGHTWASDLGCCYYQWPHHAVESLDRAESALKGDQSCLTSNCQYNPNSKAAHGLSDARHVL